MSLLVGTYDHTAKVGNHGDVAKHAVLAKIVGRLATASPSLSAQRLTYVESHSGRPTYRLAQKGPWKAGIGEFLRRTRGREVEFPHLVNLAGLYPDGLEAGSAYLGSPGLVWTIGREVGVTIHMVLHDVDSLVCDDLIRFFHPFEEVAVCLADGYAGAASLDCDLLMIDPPSLDEAHDVLQLLARARATSVICWMPRSSQSSTPAREASTSLGFFEAIRATKKWGIARIKWSSWGTRLPGCQIVVSPQLLETAANCLRQLGELMEWEVDVSSP